MTSTASRIAAGVFVVAATAASLSACSGSHPAAAKATGAQASVTPSAPVIANDPKARPAVSMKTCKPSSTGSGWGAGGTVTNPHSKDATYTIVVSFTTKQSTVLARGTTKVTVKGGQTKDWAADANFAKTKSATCVLRGVSES